MADTLRSLAPRLCAGWTRRTRPERGASLVEYGLLLALIFVVCVGAVQAFGSSTAGAMSSYTTAL